MIDFIKLRLPYLPLMKSKITGDIIEEKNTHHFSELQGSVFDYDENNNCYCAENHSMCQAN